MTHRLQLSFSLLILASVMAFAQVPNGGFETWVNGDPSQWLTGNAPPQIISVSQVSTAHSGSSAAKGIVISLSGIPITPALLAGTDGNGFPYTQRATAVTGYYQMVPMSGSTDQLIVNLVMQKGTNQTMVGVGTAILPASSAFKQFTAPIIFSTGDTPDNCYLQFMIGGSLTGAPTIGSYFIIDDIALTTGATEVHQDDASIPDEFRLEQNYPNPFNPSTVISYQLKAASKVKLTVLNALGQVIGVLDQGNRGAGRHSLRWDAAGQPSGIYFCQLQATPGDGSQTGMFNQTRKMLLVR